MYSHVIEQHWQETAQLPLFLQPPTNEKTPGWDYGMRGCCLYPHDGLKYIPSVPSEFKDSAIGMVEHLRHAQQHLLNLVLFDVYCEEIEFPWKELTPKIEQV
jgi:hypothetical protein